MNDGKNLQVNVNFTEVPELFEALEKMVADDMMDRSKFIKKLVRREVERRSQLALPGMAENSKKPANKARKPADSRLSTAA